MNKADEDLTRALITGNEELALQAVKEGITPDLQIRAHFSVETTEGNVKDLSGELMGDPKRIAGILGMKKLVAALSKKSDGQPQKPVIVSRQLSSQEIARKKQLAKNLARTQAFVAAIGGSGWEMV